MTNESNAPTLIGYKATWVREAPFPGSRGYLSSSSVSDAYTPENILFYAERDHTIIDVWAIYETADGELLFTVNLDGTLRSIKACVKGYGEMQPLPEWTHRSHLSAVIDAAISSK